MSNKNSEVQLEPFPLKNFFTCKNGDSIFIARNLKKLIHWRNEGNTTDKVNTLYSQGAFNQPFLVPVCIPHFNSSYLLFEMKPDSTVLRLREE